MHRPGGLGLALETRQPPRGRVEDRDEPRFEQQRVPLEPQEHLPDDAEGEVEGPEQQEHRRLGDPRDQQQRQRGPTPGHQPQRAVAGAQPAESGEEPVGSAAVGRARLVEEVPGGEDPVLAHEPRDLDGERHERDKVNEPQQTQEQPPG